MGQLAAPFLPASQDSSVNTRCTIFDTGYYRLHPLRVVFITASTLTTSANKGGEGGHQCKLTAQVWHILYINQKPFTVIKQLVVGALLSP